jgi:Flp pilus assembly pilin Flp
LPRPCIAAIAAMQGLGNQLKNTFGKVNTKVGSGTAAS